MPRGQHINIINNSQGNMVPQEPRYPITASPKCFKLAEAQQNGLKIYFMKMLEVIKEEMDKPLQKVQENTQKNGGNQ